MQNADTGQRADKHLNTEALEKGKDNLSIWEENLIVIEESKNDDELEHFDWRWG